MIKLIRIQLPLIKQPNTKKILIKLYYIFPKQVIIKLFIYFI